MKTAELLKHIAEAEAEGRHVTRVTLSKKHLRELRREMKKHMSIEYAGTVYSVPLWTGKDIVGFAVETEET